MPRQRKKADTARSDGQALQAKATTAKQMSDQAAMAFQAADKQDQQLKAALARADQQLQAGRKKAMDTEKRLVMDQQTLQAREKAVADADADVVRQTQAAAMARKDAEAAALALDTARSKYHFRLAPVVGFSADWAGPEAVESLEKATYVRWIPNMIGVPRRMIDWSLFNREVQREFKGRFDEWIFWENPDLDDSPQSIPPAKYAEMLKIFSRWVKLYSPNARVVAGGFNFNKSLRYLQRIPDLDKLRFDEIQVRLNLGELAPEHADVEGYLDDLNAVLKTAGHAATVRITELDWPIGKFLTPLQQAAYHARAALILDSRGVEPHLFNLINTGFEFEGYGVFYRVPYGNTAELQTFLPYSRSQAGVLRPGRGKQVPQGLEVRRQRRSRRPQPGRQSCLPLSQRHRAS